MTGDIKARLRNWGRYCRIDTGAPDSSCRNSLYDLMVYRDDEGYGEVTADTVIVPQDIPARPEWEDVDEDDAEFLDGIISAAEFPAKHRAILAVHYVLRMPCRTPEAQDRLEVAVLNVQVRVSGEWFKECVNG